MTNSYNGDNRSPPQCSNLSLSWPTSLESPIIDTRDVEQVSHGVVYNNALPPPPPPQARSPNPNPNPDPNPEPQTQPAFLADGDTSSSNKTNGNTTKPPSMFGIIPLGNSFSIPVTYGRGTKTAKGLSEDYISDTPTTWTSQGVTHMNWTVTLAKGTRFIIVAGIGSDEQWASGGSSEMLTVGQGKFDCLNHDGGTPQPTITASSTSSGRLVRPTSTGDHSPSKKENMGWLTTLLVCLFTVLGTLVVVTLFYCCCRVHRQRNKARKAGVPAPGILSVATYGRLGKKPPSRIKRYNEHGDSGADLRLDLIGARDHDDGSYSTSTRSGQAPQSRPGTDYVNESPTYHDTPLRASGYSNASFTSRSPTADDPPYTYFAHQTASPVASPSPEGRTYSSEPLEYRPESRRQSTADFAHTNEGAASANSPVARSRPLQLHDPSQLDYPQGSDDITDLKRETLALLHATPTASRAPGPSRRRRTEDTYVIHQDGGRVAVAPTQGRVLELPPRYEELNWEIPDTSSALPTRSQTFDGANIPLPPSPVVGSSYPSSPAESHPSNRHDPRASPVDSRAPSIFPPSLRSPSTAPSIPPGADDPHPPGSGSRDRMTDRRRSGSGQ